MNPSITTIDFDTLFPDVRESGETRLRQCQLVMLRMLKIFDHLCTRHNIQYFLTGGTLLGAVRHGGFIPWDDDLDIGMKRKDYNRFLKLAAQELPKDIFFQNIDTDPDYPLCHQVEAKLRDRYSKYISKFEGNEERYRRWHNGIQLDIFVYDGAFLPHNAFLYYENHFFRKYFRRYKYKHVRAKVLQLIEKLSPFPLAYASSYLCLRNMINGGGCFKKAGELKRLERMRFEDMEVLAPCGWHNYLTRMYGDYMQLPPAEKQVGHHGIAVADPFTACDHRESLQWQKRYQLKELN